MALADPIEDSGKRARVKAANRQSILDAARSVFAELGYEGATVRDIIRRTNLASGTFYNYFKSKEEVFQALTADSIGRFRPVLAHVRQSSTSFEDYIRGAYNAYFAFVADESRRGLSPGADGHSLISEIRVDPPEMKAVFEEIRTDIERALAEQGRSGLDAEYLTAAAIGIARELATHMLARQPIDVDDAGRFAADIFLNGVCSSGECG